MDWKFGKRGGWGICKKYTIILVYIFQIWHVSSTVFITISYILSPLYNIVIKNRIWKNFRGGARRGAPSKSALAFALNRTLYYFPLLHIQISCDWFSLFAVYVPMNTNSTLAAVIFDPHKTQRTLDVNMFVFDTKYFAYYSSSVTFSYDKYSTWNLRSLCGPVCRTTLVATRFRVAVIWPIIQVPHCIRVFFYFVWFVFINHIFSIF